MRRVPVAAPDPSPVGVDHPLWPTILVLGVAAGTDTTADSLWPLVLVLAEIAERVERQAAIASAIVPREGIRKAADSWPINNGREPNQRARDLEETA
jgi:hypothetical protein